MRAHAGRRGWRTGTSRWHVAARATMVPVWIGIAACGEGGSRGPQATGVVDTLPSGVIQVSNPAEGRWSDASVWHLVQDLRIGRVDSEGPDLFGRIADIAVDGEGRIHVLESQAHEVRVFDADGDWLRTLGGQGEGPGELDVPFGGAVYVLDDGTVVVNNSMNRRWELFTGQGDFMTSVPIASMSFGTGGTVGPDGAIYQRDMTMVAPGDRRTALLRWTREGAGLVVSDTLEAPELPEATTFEVSSVINGRPIEMNFPVPFVHQPVWHFGSDGRFRVEPGEGYRIVVLDRDLDTLRIIEREYTPVPVTDAEIAERERALQGGPMAEADLDRSVIPEHHPAFTTLRLDDTGHLWVQRHLGVGARAWDVFDPEGRYLGEVRSEVPLERFTLHAIRDGHVYGVLTDDLDVPYVVRLEIRSSRGS